MTRIQVICLALLLTAATAYSQVAGRLSGSVVDQSGAAVSGAGVNVYLAGGKEPLLKATTNEAGIFFFIAVRPDRYDVAVDAKGFARTVLRDVKVDPVQETGLPQIKLEVAATVQTVDVTTGVQSVQLSNAEVSSTITNSQIENLPLLGRQISNLFSTQAGVTSGSDVTSVNGLRSSYSSVTLDGINIQDNYIRTNALDYMPMRTTIDQIAEITVATSNSSATTGGSASQFVLSTKSGSNTFHGSVYWFNRNSALAANDWFNNQSGVKQTFLDLNQPGAALGGRILRDKLFFYVNYELYRNKEQSSRLRTVLTDPARNGIFSYRDTGGTLHSVNLQSLRNFQEDPTIKAMIGQLPEPNSGGTGDGLNTTGYRFNARSNEYRDQFVYKMDYYLSAKHGLTGTYNYISNPTDRPDLGAFYTTLPPVSNSLHNHLMSLAWRWTATPTLTNEARVGFLRANGNFDVANPYPSQVVAGLLFSNPVNTYMANGRQTNTYSIQDNANWIRGKHAIQFGFQSTLVRITPFSDGGIVPTITLGISTANATGLAASELPGITTANLATANSLYANLAGIKSSASQTFNVTSQTSGYVPGATYLRHLSYNTFAGYAQDNWKVLPHLTVSLGLRYEVWTPVSEQNSLYLMPRLENNNIVQTLLDPGAILDYAGGPGKPLYKTDKNNFAPNVGLAWDPTGTGKTSVRAGYMVAYVNDNVVTAVNNNAGTAAGLSSTATITGLTGTLQSPTTVATPAFLVPRTLADNYALSSAAAVGRPNPDLVTPYVQQWTLGVQHDFKGTMVEARYVGNHGTKLLRAFDYNQVLYNANGFLADFQRAQNNLALSKGASGAYNPAIAGSQPLTVFPLLASGGLLTNATIIAELQQGQVGDLASLYQSNGLNGAVNFFTNPNVLGANTVGNSATSSYHALVLELRKRTRGGLQYQFSYAFSKVLANTSGDSQTDFEPLLDNNNPRLERARAPYDITNAFKANFYYELPYGAGKKWSGGPVMNQVLGGWAVSGIWSFQSGAPFSVLSSLGTLNRAARSTATNTASVNGANLDALNAVTSGTYMTGTGPYFVSPAAINPIDGRGAEYGSTFAGETFFNPTAGNVGNLQRRLFDGPWQWSWDMSVKKSFRFHERHTLDFHFDFFNWMNHPTFFVPPSTAGDYGSTTNFNINGTSFGKITSMNLNPRIIQIGAYYKF